MRLLLIWCLFGKQEMFVKPVYPPARYQVSIFAIVRDILILDANRVATCGAHDKTI